MNNAITEIKGTLEGTNNIITKAEDGTPIIQMLGHLAVSERSLRLC